MNTTQQQHRPIRNQPSITTQPNSKGEHKDEVRTTANPHTQGCQVLDPRVNPSKNQGRKEKWKSSTQYQQHDLISIQNQHPCQKSESKPHSSKQEKNQHQKGLRPEIDPTHTSNEHKIRTVSKTRKKQDPKIGLSRVANREENRNKYEATSESSTPAYLSHGSAQITPKT